MVIAHVAKARFLADGVVQVHSATAGHQKDVAHAPVRQLLRDVVGKPHDRAGGSLQLLSLHVHI